MGQKRKKPPAMLDHFRHLKDFVKKRRFLPLLIFSDRCPKHRTLLIGIHHRSILLDNLESVHAKSLVQNYGKCEKHCSLLPYFGTNHRSVLLVGGRLTKEAFESAVE